MSQGKIRVEGRASRWVPADHVDVSFTVTRRSKASSTAVADAGEAYAALDKALADHAHTIVRRTTTSISVHEVVRHEPRSGRAIREGFEASRTQTARFAPVVGASAALRAAVKAVPDLRIDGPAFGLDPSNPAHANVRVAAAASARTSAQAYAAGVGLSLGPVLRLEEPRSDGGHPFVGGMAMRAMAPGGADDLGSTVLVDLTDEDVEVTAVIELVVAIADVDRPVLANTP